MQDWHWKLLFSQIVFLILIRLDNFPLCLAKFDLNFVSSNVSILFTHHKCDRGKMDFGMKISFFRHFGPFCNSLSINARSRYEAVLKFLRIWIGLIMNPFIPTFLNYQMLLGSYFTYQTYNPQLLDCTVFMYKFVGLWSFQVR